jgi:single-strand DNA-binding protein
MPNLNKVMLMGNLTRDPQLTFTPNQTAICKIGLAVNRRWSGQDGQLHEETTFVDCDAFGRTAETLAKYLTKGRPVFIEGRLHYNQWQAQDGSNRSKLTVTIESFQFVDSRPGGGAGGGDEAEGGAPRPAYQPRQNARPVAGRPGPAARPASSNDMDPPSPDEDDAPPIRDEDIPF